MLKRPILDAVRQVGAVEVQRDDVRPAQLAPIPSPMVAAAAAAVIFCRYRRKGVLDFIEALAILRRQGTPFAATISGIGPDVDPAKALAAGADAVMMGSMFAGSEEAPGEVELYQGRTYKSYRGMGSIGAMSKSQGSSDRYFQDSSVGAEKLVPEGIEGRVPYKGPVSAIIHQLMGGVRSAMGYAGCATMEKMRTEPQFVRVTSAGMSESHVHDVSITKEAPNYPVR